MRFQFWKHLVISWLLALLFLSPALAGLDQDDEFLQAPEDGSEGSICIADGLGGTICINASDLDGLLAGANLWFESDDVLSPVDSADVVEVPAGIVAGAGSGPVALQATVSGTDEALRVTQVDDGVAIRVTAGTVWIEGSASDPGSPEEGEIWYNTTDHVLRYYDGSSTIDIGTGGGGGGGGMTSFTLAGDTGSSQTISNSNTLSVLTDGNLTSTAAATDKVTISLDDTAVSAGTYSNCDLTVDAKGRLTAAASGTVALGSEVSGVLPMANGGLAVALTDPNASRLGYWDDTAGQWNWLRLGGGFAIDESTDLMTYTPTVYYQTVRDEGSAETQRGKTNFIGPNVNVTDDAGNDETEVTISDFDSHMLPVGVYAVNATDVTTGTSNTTYAVYIGTANRDYTTCTVCVRTTTALSGNTWAEVGILKGDFNPGAGPSLTRCGYTDVSSTYNGLAGTKQTTITLSSVTAGDDLWFAWGSQATTTYKLRGLQVDNLASGVMVSAGSTRISTMSASTSFSVDSSTSPARVIVSL